MRGYLAIDSLFAVRSGDFHATDKELGPGRVPLVSCGDVNHGLVGFYDIPEANQYQDAVTVAYNGDHPLVAKYRPYVFGAKDDIGVLEPREPISPRALVFIAVMLNARRWRYSYGRKCFKTKLESVEVEVPVQESKQGARRIDLGRIDSLLGGVPLDMRPRASAISERPVNSSEWSEKRLDQLFDLTRGDFHSLSRLADGEFATVSRTEADNGVVGYYERPDESTLYPPGVVTVSTVSGDAFVQAGQFIATDNVVVCLPKEQMRRTSSYFIASMINRQKWRYGYGRQPYIGKLSALTVQLPWREGRMDEAAMEDIVRRQPYWSFVSESTEAR